MRLPFLCTFHRPCGVGALQYVSRVKAWKNAFLFVSFGDDCGGGDDDDDGDDIYIMMSVCLFVCLSRKMITSSWESPVTT